MKIFYKGGRGLAYSQREEGTNFRTDKPPRLSKILIHPVRGESFGLASATVRQVVDVSSEYPRALFDTCSGAVREVFECCSGGTRRTPEGHPKDYRRSPESFPKRTRRASEEQPNSTRRNRWFFQRFLDKLKAGIKYRCSKDVVPFTQLLRKIGEVRLMYQECTVSVRGVYRKGTKEVLRRYWRATKDLLNACTSGVDQRYSKRRREVRVAAMKNRVTFCLAGLLCFTRKLLSLMALKNKSMPSVLALIWFSFKSLFFKATKNKVILPYGLLCFILFNLSNAWAQSAETRTAERQTKVLVGEARSATDDKPIQGVSLRVNEVSAITDEEGRFRIPTSESIGTVEVRHIGFQPQSIDYDETTTYLTIILEPLENQIDEVEVVSTGYQQLPKERATGSFVQIDNEMMNRRVSTNIVERLDGMAPGILTNLKRKQRGQGDVEIRGRSTLYSNSEPLIVLDNFPYEGDLESINPNDIENMTILKDAAAASIWGVRASNGVVVITTKSGKMGRKPVIEFNTNLSLAGKRNVFEQPLLSSAEFVEIERFLFERGRYNAILNTGWQPVSPVVEVLARIRSEELSEEEGNRIIDGIAGQDAREQYNTYFNQPLFNQQYSASARGATASHDYFISAGLDKNRPQTVGNSFERWTMQAANTFRFLDDRITLAHRILYSNKIDRQEAYAVPSAPRYPYSQYIDATGNHLPEVSSLRLSYIDGLTENRLQDWHMRPMDDLTRSDFYSNHRVTNLRNSLQLEAKLAKGLKASAFYLYEESYSDSPTYYGPQSYYTRHQINSFSYLNSDGDIEYGIPMGAIKHVRTGKQRNQTGRLQAEYDNRFREEHQLNILLGMEIRENTGLNASYGLYGYNEENQTNQNHLVNYVEPFRMWHSGQSSRISTLTDQSSITDRFVSYYSNLMYAFKDRYRLSGSLRRDGSNLFGVQTNQKFVPLWSVGGLWDVHKEAFFPEDIFSRLQLRVSYGYNGNLNRSVSGYLTARQGAFVSMYGQPYYEIVNPPNPALRWERVRNINVGIDLATRSQRISGTVEYWQKRGQDLIANRPTPTQTGITGFTGNTAAVLTKGVDIAVTTRNIEGSFNWSNQLFLSRVTNRVLDYHVVPATNFAIMSNIYDYPQIDHPQFSLFAFSMKGLNETGSPIGYLAGEETEDYRAIKNSQDLSEMSYMGSSAPTVHGTLWNRFGYASFELSFSIRWYGGHYFRRNSLDNAAIYNGSYTIWDYQTRWQSPGDERHTTVPALVYPNNINRSDFYKYADLLIEPAGHVRLQDLQFSYNAIDMAERLSLSRARIIFSATDIGVLWKQNRRSIDPLFTNGNPIRTTYSLGIQLTL